jgi:galactokinase
VITATAPGRVNLIGDHTDYLDGFVLPMAIDRGTTVTGEPGGDRVILRSDHDPLPADVPLDVDDPAATEPAWARYVAGVVAELRPAEGFTGEVATTLPVGGGLSSSAALEVAVALALGFDGPPLDLARLCQRAEQRSSGVPSGIMDQLASAAGVASHALLIDCRTLALRPIRLAVGAEIVIVDSGEARTLVGSAYAERRAEAETAAQILGPLRDASLLDLPRLADEPRLQARARHVISENARVWAFADALEGGWLAEAGALMAASHASLRDDYEVSTPTLDTLVDRLQATPGVYGARLTGAGFGGCVVALTEPGALHEGWVVRPSAGASCRGSGPSGPRTPRR